MRKLLAVLGLAALMLVLGNMTLMSQQGYTEGKFTQDQLNAWQAIAETYYVAGVDENFILNAPPKVAAGELEARWSYAKPDLVQGGMIAPDFTQLDMEGVPHSLSEYRGKAFVILTNGSWY